MPSLCNEKFKYFSKKKEFNHNCNGPSSKFWYLTDIFPSEVLDENNPSYFKKNSSVCLKIEAEMSFYEECGSSQKYFSGSLSETSKTFRHSLKNDLERFFRSNLKGCDVILRCENKDFPVHKLSPSVASLLYSVLCLKVI
ncbi:hypothetical protein TNIN_111731 [Trichonephila inaurata madagascariensis]|uniref:BTB domain-containing protein n=1 Tax=Trichonephila inaurata madagascariensis TaxID=2747483 RepID=A0A8X7CH09_9ARAC|nr:hypothetical protein TNIN_111731 [Trichonephila inaurata madagascariensis]